jgi:chromosome segregation ATPase
VRQNEDRELVPLKADFDTVWRGYRRSQVQFYLQQTENEVRMLTEDRDSALSQVTGLSAELEQARSEIESLRRQLDDACRQPVDEAGLPDRLRRMVRLAQDEADEVISSARATAEHEWTRSEEAAAELRARYQRLVEEADEWRRQAEVQRNEVLESTRQDIERMAREAEQHRRQMDNTAEQRRIEVEEDFEISMNARREEALRVLAERDQASRAEAERRIREATEESRRRIRRADEHAEAMRRMRQDVAQRVRSAQQVLQDAEPFLAASEVGTENEETDAYVAATVHEGQEAEQGVTVPTQRVAEAAPETEAAAQR